jgi:hypothetical protein
VGELITLLQLMVQHMCSGSDLIRSHENLEMEVEDVKEDVVAAVNDCKVTYQINISTQVRHLWMIQDNRTYCYYWN